MTDTANELIARARQTDSDDADLLDALADALEAAEANLENAIAAFNASCAETDKYEARAVAAEAENARLLALARNVTTAFTAEAEDWNDGEYALWKKDDLIAALVALRVAVPPARAARGGERDG